MGAYQSFKTGAGHDVRSLPFQTTNKQKGIGVEGKNKGMQLQHPATRFQQLLHMKANRQFHCIVAVS